MVKKRSRKRLRPLKRVQWLERRGRRGGGVIWEARNTARRTICYKREFDLRPQNAMAQTVVFWGYLGYVAQGKGKKRAGE